MVPEHFLLWLCMYPVLQQSHLLNDGEEYQEGRTLPSSKDSVAFFFSLTSHLFSPHHHLSPPTFTAGYYICQEPDD
jgi:hypothetical protein